MSKRPHQPYRAGMDADTLITIALLAVAVFGVGLVALILKRSAPSDV
jgi:hypothetical protein